MSQEQLPGSKPPSQRSLAIGFFLDTFINIASAVFGIAGAFGIGFFVGPERVFLFWIIFFALTIIIIFLKLWSHDYIAKRIGGMRLQELTPFMWSHLKSQRIEIEGLSTSQEQQMVNDLQGGLNLRFKDNLYQAITISVFIVVGSITGALMTEHRLPAAILGGIIGMVVGFFLSGLVLMFYYTVKYIRKGHD